MSLRSLLAKALNKSVIDAMHNADLTTVFGRMSTRMIEQAVFLIDTHALEKTHALQLAHFQQLAEHIKTSVTMY